MRMFNLVCRAAVLVVSCITIACTDSAEPQPEAGAAADVGQTQTLPSTLPAPDEAAPRYVGLWATTAEGCGDPAWRFEERGISTRGEVSCEFLDVTVTERGYDIQAQCVAQAPPESHRIQLFFAESARAMMISGGPWSQGIALTFCGPLSSQ